MTGVGEGVNGAKKNMQYAGIGACQGEDASRCANECPLHALSGAGSGATAGASLHSGADSLQRQIM